VMRCNQDYSAESGEFKAALEVAVDQLYFGGIENSEVCARRRTFAAGDIEQSLAVV